ncbi:hypothetical protein HIM_07607 [Hirsutella minnesotensis 3608]|uniref:Zn(2)-C6 fungal-type domain-containing protein n=1 Tax=Hirsutella minnesotensis 3608 TaxID=1043627 RepID=A0A0F7ZN30_9HYPO|nr:hypothetical protein HIM_07607 [Hirsutella minnesotensis 3608]
MASASGVGGGSASGVPAGYGRSCTNCSRAKCRCILRPQGGSCERCHRLGKECHQIAAARKRTSRRSANSRAAQLEEKLEDLVSMLRATQRAGQPAVPMESEHQPEAGAQQPAPQQFPSRLDSLAAAATADTSPSPIDRPSCIGPTPGSDSSFSLGNAQVRPEPTQEEAELYLARFRQWLKTFPFMYISPEMTAQALRKQRPFLWMCIMNLTTTSVPQMLMLRDKIREHVSRKLVLEYEANMDFLLGLVAHLAWANTNTGAGVRPFIIMYSQLATALIYDMGLSRAPNDEQQSSVYLKICGPRPPPALKTRTMEERRAILAFWFCSSVLSAFIGKMEPFGWTTHMDDCLDLLERQPEQPQDETLVALVRIQLIGEEVRKLQRRDGDGDFGQGPTYIHKPNLLSRLRDLRQRLPAAVHSQHAILLHLHCLEAQIHSIGLFTEQVIPVTMRTSSLYACTKAATAWCDALFTVTIPEISGMSFALYVGLAQILAIMYKLIVSEDPAWDKEILRSTANLSVLLGRLTDLFDRVSESYYIGNDDGTPLNKVPRILRNASKMWEPAITYYLGPSLATPSSDTMNVPPVEPKMMADNQVVPEVPAFDLGDLTWMTDIFGPWEFH